MNQVVISVAMYAIGWFMASGRALAKNSPRAPENSVLHV